MPGLSLGIAGLHRTFGPELDHYLDVARVADEVGIDQLVLADHVVMGQNTGAYPYGEFAFAPEEPWAEPLTLLTAIAAVTTRVRLGTGILITPLRTPASLAKTVATLDTFSGGRVDLGVGVGWQREEYDVAGVPWAERWSRLDDGLRACRALWADGAGLVHQPQRQLHRHLVPTRSRPGPVAGLVGGQGHRSQLRPRGRLGRRLDAAGGQDRVGRALRRHRPPAVRLRRRRPLRGRAARPGRPAVRTGR